jgi:hypothetical protein
MFFMPETKGLNLEGLSQLFLGMWLLALKRRQRRRRRNIVTVHVEDVQKTKV